MKKTKTFKFSLILLSIVTAVILLFTTQASYASDSNDGDTHGTVTVTGTSTTAEFRTYDTFQQLCFEDNRFKDEKNLTISIDEDFYFFGQVCSISQGRTFTFELNNHYLYSKNDSEMIDVINGGTLILKSGYFEQTGGTPSIVVGHDGQVRADNVYFKRPADEASEASKGGVFVFSDISRDQFLTNCYFNQNKAEKGGAIYVRNAYENSPKIIVDKCNFVGCHASDEGGAIYNNSDDDEHVDFVFNNTSFKSCNAGDSGGAIFSYGDCEKLTFNDCTIDSCTACNGGAICNKSIDSDYEFHNSTIKNCQANKCGGAIFSSKDHENYYFYNSIIEKCVAVAGNEGFLGGAFYMRSSISNIFGFDPDSPTDKSKYSTIKNCEARAAGGAIYTSSETSCGNQINIKGFNFVSNKALKGGAIEVEGAKNHIENCCFIGNDGEGGAIGYCSGISPNLHLMIKGCYFDGNTNSRWSEDGGFTAYFDTDDLMDNESGDNIIKADNFSMDKHLTGEKDYQRFASKNLRFFRFV